MSEGGRRRGRGSGPRAFQGKRVPALFICFPWNAGTRNTVQFCGKRIQGDNRFLLLIGPMEHVKIRVPDVFRLGGTESVIYLQLPPGH